MARDTDTDLILITESWCNDEISNAFLSIDGYELQTDLRMDRGDTYRGRGGGLLVYSRQGEKIVAAEKEVRFHQYCKFFVRDVTVYLIYSTRARN